MFLFSPQNALNASEKQKLTKVDLSSLLIRHKWSQCSITYLSMCILFNATLQRRQQHYRYHQQQQRQQENKTKTKTLVSLWVNEYTLLKLAVIHDCSPKWTNQMIECETEKKCMLIKGKDRENAANHTRAIVHPPVKFNTTTIKVMPN